jgi:Predicted membrane protein (DUF2142)
MDWRAGTARLWCTPRRIFVTAFVLFFVTIATWSFATPFFASPDEPAHVSRAVALVHGQLIGHTIKSASNPLTIVRVPGLYVYGGAETSCFGFKPTVSASCSGPLRGTKRDISAQTYVGRYPPLYYAIVGLPSLASVSAGTLYAMRLMSALIGSMFLALAVMAIAVWSKSRFLLVAVLAATTPMTFFLASVVNPSGLEITSAVCLWSAGLVLVLEHADDPPKELIGVMVAGAVGLMLSRSLSPLWVVLILGLLAILGGKAVVFSIAKSRAALRSLFVLIPCGIFAVIWIVAAHALDLLPVGQRPSPNESHAHLVASIFGSTESWLQQMVGVFGWLDTVAPFVTNLAWYGVVGFILLLALSSGTRRQLLVLFLLVAIVIVVPVGISYNQAQRLGVIWQGRYIMPMAVGIPLLAVAIFERSGALAWLRPRLTTVCCVILTVGQLFAFGEALRRYTVGTTGPLNFLNGTWSPPGGTVFICLLEIVALVLLALMVRILVSNHRLWRATPPVAAEEADSDQPLEHSSETDGDLALVASTTDSDVVDEDPSGRQSEATD